MQNVEVGEWGTGATGAAVEGGSWVVVQAPEESQLGTEPVFPVVTPGEWADWLAPLP